MYMDVYFNIICVTTKEAPEERMTMLSNGAMFKDPYIAIEWNAVYVLVKTLVEPHRVIQMFPEYN